MKFDLNSVACVVLGSLLAQISPALAAPLQGHDRSLAPRAGEEAAAAGLERSAYLVMDVNMRFGIESVQDGREIFATHSFLQFGPTAKDGPFRLELVYGREQDKFAIRGLDQGLGSTARGIGTQGRNGAMREIFELPQKTSLTNEQILSAKTGKGLALNVWKRDPFYRVGPVVLKTRPIFGELGALTPPNNGCNAFARNMLREMFGAELRIPQNAAKMLNGGIEFSGTVPAPFEETITDFLWARTTTAGASIGPVQTIVFDVKDAENPVRLTPELSLDAETVYIDEVAKTPGGVEAQQPIGDPATEVPKVASPFEAQAQLPFADDDPPLPVVGEEVPVASPVKVVSGEAPVEPFEMVSPFDGFAPFGSSDSAELPVVCPRDSSIFRRQCAASSVVRPASQLDMAVAEEVTLVRVGGVLSTVTTVGLRVAKGVGIVATIAAPVFIILDLVHGNYVGAAFGAAGLVLGLAIGLLDAGPVGWVIAGAAAVVFAILPGLWNRLTSPPKPPANDAVKIIQFVMFGDPNHTGNEACRKQGNKDCVALFGPGVLAHVFTWNNLDAFAFLIHFNDGHHMTIPDMARAFSILDPANPTATDNSPAVIDCQNDDPRSKYCTNPVLRLNRDQLVIPTLNRTAADVLPRVIPQPFGDCKLVADSANGFRYTNYGVTVHGRPCRIVCGIHAFQNVSGTSMPFAATSVINGASANQQPINALSSTNPPAAIAFTPLQPRNGVVCLGSTRDNTRQCFPPGVYPNMPGAFGWDLRHASNLTMPPGASFTWGKTPLITVNTTDARFASDAALYDPSKDAMTATVPTGTKVAPQLCLFAQPEYQGDVACFGLGGGDLPIRVQNAAKSVKVWGDAVVWLYAEKYGDVGGLEVTVDVPDLSSVAYGAKGDWSRKAVAAWIS